MPQIRLTRICGIHGADPTRLDLLGVVGWTMRCLVLLGVLVGCVEKRGGDSTPEDATGDSASDSPGDSANDSPGDSTGDSSVDAPPCELSHPWAMDSVEHVGLAGALAYPSIAVLTLLDGNAVTGARSAAAYGDPCPLMTESDDGATVTITGDCTTSFDGVYGGSVTFTDTDSASSSAYDHFHFEDGMNPFAYDIDGTWSFSWADRTFSVDLTVTMLGEWIPGLPDVTATYQTTGSATLIEGYADIISQPNSGATGDLCVSDAYEYVDSCDSEGDELVSLWGTIPATLTWNGSTNCDGCADVTIDGVDAGSYCPSLRDKPRRCPPPTSSSPSTRGPPAPGPR